MTGERLYPCRMPPNGVSTLIHTKRRFCRLRDMQQNRPEGSMEVAIDTNPHGLCVCVRECVCVCACVEDNTFGTTKQANHE
jgi:hypothetical protein